MTSGKEISIVATHESSSSEGTDTNNSKGYNHQDIEMLMDAKSAKGEDAVNVAASSDEEQVDAPRQANLSSIPRVLFRKVVKYLKSYNGREIFICFSVAVLLLVISLLVEELPHSPRPIPRQYIESAQAFVLNLTFNETSNGDTFSDFEVGLLVCAIVPLFQMLCCVTGGRLQNKRTKGDLHRTMCVHLLSVATNDILTWLLKSYVGYLRPNFYQVCRPNDTYDYCTNTDKGASAFDYGGSFPSGHVSFTQCSLTLVYFYLERTFGVSSVEQAFVMTEEETVISTSTDSENVTTTTKRCQMGIGYTHPPTLYRLKSILCGLPIVAGWFMAGSRIVDNRHHPSDVVAGGVMGTCIAILFHYMWFQDHRYVPMGLLTNKD